MLGVVPVTVNWQADTGDRVAYKIRSTKSKAVFVDAGVDVEQISALNAEFPDVSFITIDVLDTAAPLPTSEFCSDPDLGGEETRIVIFTSGEWKPRPMISIHTSHTRARTRAHTHHHHHGAARSGTTCTLLNPTTTP